MDFLIELFQAFGIGLAGVCLFALPGVYLYTVIRLALEHNAAQWERDHPEEN